MRIAPFAEYQLTEVPTGIEVTMESPLVLDPQHRITAARHRGDDIYVTGPALLKRGWGGRRNHAIDCRDGVWWLFHLGHGCTIGVNDGEIGVMPDHHTLEDGDRIQPATGLVFTFRIRDDVEQLAAELARKGLDLDADLVLLDWILERGYDLDGAQRVLRHLRTRR